MYSPDCFVCPCCVCDLPPPQPNPTLPLQATLFIGGVVDSEQEVRELLEPFGPIVRTIVVTNPVVGFCC